MTAQLHATFFYPGPPMTRTGGFGYDRRVVDGLRRLGVAVDTVVLDGAFPDIDARARGAADAALGALPPGRVAVVDGLAYGAMPEVVAAHADRVRLVALVHHPLALEAPPDGPDGTAARRRALAVGERRALAHARAVVATSEHTARTLAADYGVPGERLRAVPPGTDPAAPAPRAGTARTLLALGSLTPRKGQDVLLRAFARAAPRHDLHLDVVGDPARAPAFADRLRELAAELGVADRVRFRGAVDDAALEACWAAAGALALASWHEGYGMAHAEALARGLPVLATAAGAVPDVVPAGAGLLVPPGDADALADALDRFFGDAGLRARLVAGARRAGAALPTWDDAARGLAATLREVAGS